MRPLMVPPTPHASWSVAAQVIADTVEASITFTTSTADSAGFGTPGATITIPSGMGGWWTFAVHVAATTAGGGNHSVSVTTGGLLWRLNDSGSTKQMMTGWSMYLAPADTFSIQVKNSSGASSTYLVTLLMVQSAPL